MTTTTDLKVYLTPEAHAQIMFFVNKSSDEISGLGRIIRDPLGRMVVNKVYLLDQENTGTTTDIDEGAMSKLLFETREDKGDLNFWWHSHVNMGVFWSGTDMATIKQFGSKGYIVATVFNKKGEHRSAYLQGGTGFLPELFVDNIPTAFAYIAPEETEKAWEAEYTAKCRKKSYSYTGGINPYLGMGGDDEYDGFGYDDQGNYRRGFRDQHYYAGGTAPKTTPKYEEYIGNNSKLTTDQIISRVRGWFYQAKKPFEQLTTDEWMILADAYEFANDDYATDLEMEEFYDERVCKDLANMKLVIKHIQEYGARLEAERLMDDDEDDGFDEELVSVFGNADEELKKETAQLLLMQTPSEKIKASSEPRELYVGMSTNGLTNSELNRLRIMEFNARIK